MVLSHIKQHCLSSYKIRYELQHFIYFYRSALGQPYHYEKKLFNNITNKYHNTIIKYYLYISPLTYDNIVKIILSYFLYIDKHNIIYITNQFKHSL